MQLFLTNPPVCLGVVAYVRKVVKRYINPKVAPPAGANKWFFVERQFGKAKTFSRHTERFLWLQTYATACYLDSTRCRICMNVTDSQNKYNAATTDEFLQKMGTMFSQLMLICVQYYSNTSDLCCHYLVMFLCARTIVLPTFHPVDVTPSHQVAEFVIWTVSLNLLVSLIYVCEVSFLHCALQTSRFQTAFVQRLRLLELMCLDGREVK